MFRRMTIRGFGPHTSTDLVLSPTGLTEIRGYSGRGKSTIIDALLWVLGYGGRDGGPVDVDLFGEEAEVTLETMNNRLTVKRRASGLTRWTREKYAPKEGEKPYTETSAEKWRQGLSALPLWPTGPAELAALRLIVTPREWTTLAQTDATTSRRLRDAIVSSAGTTAEEEAVKLFAAAGHVRTGEVYSEKSAKAAAAEANRLLAGAEASLEQARKGLQAAQDAAPTPLDAASEAAADRLPELEAAEAQWATYDRARAAHDRLEEQRAADLRLEQRTMEEWTAACERCALYDATAKLNAERVHQEAMAAWTQESDTRDAEHAAEVGQAAADHLIAIQERAQRHAAACEAARAAHEAAKEQAYLQNEQELREWSDRCSELELHHERNIRLHREDVASVEATYAAAMKTWREQCAILRRDHGFANADRAVALDELKAWQARRDSFATPSAPLGVLIIQRGTASDLAHRCRATLLAYESPTRCSECGQEVAEPGDLDQRIYATRAQLEEAEHTLEEAERDITLWRSIEALPPVPEVPEVAPLILPAEPTKGVTTAPPAAPILPQQPVSHLTAPLVEPQMEPEPRPRTVPPLGAMRPAPTYVEPEPSPRPVKPPAYEPLPLTRPTPPSVAQPEPGAVMTARTADSARRGHAARMEQHRKQVDAMGAAVSTASEKHQKEKSAAERAGAWLAAVREAPGEIAKRLEWCKAIGTVSIELDPEKITSGAAVEVRINGRRWQRASEGELVLADYQLRRAWAKAVGVPNLMLIVDQRVAYSGALPVEGPTVVLITDDGELRSVIP
jgi:hypothetical protein